MLASAAMRPLFSAALAIGSSKLGHEQYRRLKGARDHYIRGSHQYVTPLQASQRLPRVLVLLRFQLLHVPNEPLKQFAGSRTRFLLEPLRDCLLVS